AARRSAAAARPHGPQAPGALGAQSAASADRPLRRAGGGGAMTAEPAALPKKPPQVDLDRTRERLTRLGLLHAAERLGEHVATAAQETYPPHRFLDALLEAELSARDERRVRTSRKLSGLPTGQTLSNFDFAFPPSVARSRIETLATCAWIRERESLLLPGPPGVGQT